MHVLQGSIEFAQCRSGSRILPPIPLLRSMYNMHYAFQDTTDEYSNLKDPKVFFVQNLHANLEELRSDICRRDMRPTGE